MSTSVTQEELEAGRSYEAFFVPALFAPWTDYLVDGVELKSGAHVLDIACGSGVLTRHAFARSGPSGRVVGIDPAPGMLAAAKEIEPNIEWILGSAEALPFDADTFDSIVSQFGMMFFQERTKAANEMYRVTKPGGRLAIAIWSSVDQNPAYRDIALILDEQVSTAAGDAVRAPFSLGNPTDVADIISQAGFEDVRSETKAEQAKFPSCRTMVEAELRGWLPLFGINLSEEKITDVLVKSDEKLTEFASPSGEAAFPTSAYIVTARKSR